MNDTVTIQLFGNEYTVPSELTIMTAMEYVGIQPIKGCGCRNGVCGSCTVLCRIKNENRPKIVLSCKTKVSEGMRVTALPYRHCTHKPHSLELLPDDSHTLLRLYPEVDSCIGCNTCTRNCPQDINVKQLVQHARNGNLADCAEISFSCIMCGACAHQCPQNITPLYIAMTARRIYGKWHSSDKATVSKHVTDTDNEELNSLLRLTDDEIADLYSSRDMEV